ncbi:heavy-metal-associated domain-containing protein [Paramicrobacterium sp. CJ85]|uniref:heavy-metal-associated domain-containing protein n=1 Tax=Paramicrobacterium sp. CJ85 TaxID=3445355 RepID=UPI003F61FD9D
MAFTDLGLSDKNAGGCCSGGACMCGDDHGSGAHATATAEGTVSTTFGVTGMSCGHCVNAVTEELSALGTVTGVNVDLRPGEESKVTVTSEDPLETASVRAAIEDAGYTLA